MTIEQFRERMATDEPIIGGSELHMEFHKYSQEALRITAEINGSYHTPEELRRLLSELWAIDVPESFGMFPPFYTDCGKNTHVGERVFINMGCKFQDQGGIFIDDDALIGHNATLCTLNHIPAPAQRAGMTAKPIHIGNHVWLCAEVHVMKGSHIADGSIVGYRSLVTSKFTEQNILIAGNPAQFVQSNVKWGNFKDLESIGTKQ